MSATLATVIEQQVWNGLAPRLNQQLKDAGFTDADVADYVQSLTEPPSADAKARFVTYAVLRHVDLLEIVVFDVSSQGDENFARRATMTVHLFDEQGGQTEVTVPDEACET
ncbi:MAG: hypothetical protein K8R99_15915 [Actinomycetia bacterium]|nr:hypothetical protein [Actinomycetes bacterium]